MAADEVDVVVIGSGFGGSTTALRLTEKGYGVAVLEAGRRFDESTLPETSWRIRSFLWAPRLGCYGIQRISLIKDVMVLAGAGVGGGSLNYANTLYEPLAPFYVDDQWGHITDWRAEVTRTPAPPSATPTSGWRPCDPEHRSSLPAPPASSAPCR